MGNFVSGKTPWLKRGLVSGRLKFFEEQAKLQIKKPSIKKTGKIWERHRESFFKPAAFSSKGNINVKFSQDLPATRKTKSSVSHVFRNIIKEKAREKVPRPFPQRLELIGLIKDPQIFNKQILALHQELTDSAKKISKDKQKLFLVERQQEQLSKIFDKDKFLSQNISLSQLIKDPSKFNEEVSILSRSLATDNLALQRQKSLLNKLAEEGTSLDEKLNIFKLIKGPSNFKESALSAVKELAIDHIKNKEGTEVPLSFQKLETFFNEDDPALQKMKTTHQIARALPSPKSGIQEGTSFDQFITSLLEKTVEEEDNPQAALQKQIRDDAALIYKGDAELAKLKMAKRLAFKLQGSVDPAKHSPSLSVLAKKTDFPPSVIKGSEKVFKHILSGQRTTELAEIKEGGHTYKILGSGRELKEGKIAPDVIIEIKDLAKGSYKTIKEAYDFMEQMGGLVTLSPHQSHKVEAESDNENESYHGTMVITEKEPTTAEKEQMRNIGENIQPDLSPEEEYDKEIELTRHLQGPGIVSLHKVVAGEDKKVMVQQAAGYKIGDDILIDLQGMEFFEKEKGLDAAGQRVKYQALYDSMAGLKRMHEDFNLIHRDVKNLNVLLTPTGRGALTDFGTVIEDKNVRENTFVGTPTYAPPESSTGKNITKKFDTWSVGMMIYSLCCNGKNIEDHPIVKECKHLLGKEELDPQEMVDAMYRVDPDKYESGWGDIKDKFQNNAAQDPDNFEELVYLCTRYDPQKRPTISEVMNHFKRLAQNEGIVFQDS